MAILLFILFIVSALAPIFFNDLKRLRLMGLIIGLVNAAVALYFFANPIFTGNVIEIGSLLRVDRFSAYIGGLISLLYMFTVVVSYRYIGEENHEGSMDLKQSIIYYVLLPIFALAMLLVVMADNLGLLWLALEITTLATTPLVAIYKKDGSLEAAWKYIIICSLGISLSLLGLLMISYAGLNSGLSAFDSLSLRALALNGTHLMPEVIKWGFVFAFIGIGTKVGFFPMHTWLPDAHGRTPSPISAMLSGILLNVAFYCLIRIKIISDLALGGDGWTNNLFLFFGALSIVASAFFLYIQKNYKRMLAYSSMEHMGILAVAVGLGPVGMVPALMHMFSHTFSKSLLFFGSGEILLHEKSSKIYNIKNLMRRMPLTCVFFLLGLFSLLAAPPFATFVSEIMIIGAAVAKGKLVVCFLVLIALTIVCVSLFKHTFKMFCFDDSNEQNLGNEVKVVKEKFNVAHFVMLVEVTLLVVMGIFMLTQGGYAFFSDIVKSISL